MKREKFNSEADDKIFRQGYSPIPYEDSAATPVLSEKGQGAFHSLFLKYHVVTLNT